MPDIISSRITQNIKTTLTTLSSYGGTPKAVELERMILVINARYPFIEIMGPYAEVETQTHQVAMTNFEYVIKYYYPKNDESETANTEITYLTRNVAGDIIKHLMVDPSRNQLAQITKITDYGNGFELINDNVEFYIYVLLEVRSRIDANDPYSLG